MGTLSLLQERRTTKKYFEKVKIILAATAFVCSIGIATAPQSVAAVDYDAEIKKLQTQNATNETNRQALQSEAQTLEQKIASLQATIASLGSQILDNVTEQERLAGKIRETEAEIAKNQTILTNSIRDLYIQNDMSMLEKMASSESLSEYVEREQYTVSAQAEVTEGLDRINELKVQQQKQKSAVEQLITDNKAMESRVAAEKIELNRLLAMNQTEQAAYTQTIATNNAEITDLQREQAEENARFLREQAALAAAAQRKSSSNNALVTQQAAPAGVAAVNGRSYPWANAPWPNDIPDTWGMYQRQCVSYTAWKVAASGRHMPYWGGRGNANQWDDNARAAGIPVDRTPRVGDVAVRNAGTYGHVMYVDAVNSDGSINISQYNANWDGRYSEARIFPGDLVFVHF